MDLLIPIVYENILRKFAYVCKDFLPIEYDHLHIHMDNGNQ